MTLPQFLQIFFPIYCILGIGYVSAWRGHATVQNMDGANTFLFWVSIPALVFRSLSAEPPPAREAGVLLACYFAVAIALFLITFALARKRGLVGDDPTVFAMGTIYSNTILVGLPIISNVVGDGGVVALFWIVTFHAIILFTISALSLEADRRIASWVEFGRMLRSTLRRNPIALAATAGLAFNLSGATLPAFAATPLDMVGGVTVPLGLFLVGVNLGTYRGIVAPAATLVASCGKLLVMPLAVALLTLGIFDLPRDWAVAAILVAGIPTGITVVIFSGRIDATPGFGSSIFFGSTLLSALSIPLLVALFG